MRLPEGAARTTVIALALLGAGFFAAYLRFLPHLARGGAYTDGERTALDNVTLDIPEIGEQLSDFRIASSGFSQPEQLGDRIISERWYKLQADAPGSYIIEPVKVSYQLPDGAEEKLATPRLFIEIESQLFC